MKDPPQPPWESDKALLEECIMRLQDPYNFSPTEEGQRTVRPYNAEEQNDQHRGKSEFTLEAGGAPSERPASRKRKDPPASKTNSRPVRSGPRAAPRYTASVSVQEINKDDEHTSPISVP
eukprot:gene22026-26534_t